MKGQWQVRLLLPDLMNRVLHSPIKPGRVFDLAPPFARVSEGYRAIDDRCAMKTMLTV